VRGNKFNKESTTMKNKYSFAPAKQQAEEKDQHSAAWINLLKPASVKAAEADREVQAYKEHLRTT
jgi:hypothetical protein